LPGEGPIGEAWILSDRDDHPSLVADGPLKGKTMKELLNERAHEIMGESAGRFPRFPLLLKFLDVTKALSVQVHPSDAHLELIPPGETGKTEAWVVLESNQESRIYAGLKGGATADTLRGAIADGTIEDHLAVFTPQRGDAMLVKAGTVHSLKDVVVFEVQENSDVTFRLYDWNHVDPRTGQHRALQVDQALACIDFAQGSIPPVVTGLAETDPSLSQEVFDCAHFGARRISGESPFSVGTENEPRVLVCIGGEGEVEHLGASYRFRKGDVMLLPAVVGTCLCRPNGKVTLLQLSLPKGAGHR